MMEEKIVRSRKMPKTNSFLAVRQNIEVSVDLTSKVKAISGVTITEAASPHDNKICECVPARLLLNSKKSKSFLQHFLGGAQL